MLRNALKFFGLVFAFIGFYGCLWLVLAIGNAAGIA